MQAGDHGLSRGQDVVGALHDVVGRKAPLALAEVHRATRQVQPDPYLTPGLGDGVEDRVVPAGHDVVVVGDRRRPAQGKLGQADLRRHLHIGDRDPRPDRVELLQPAEQVTACRAAPGEPLVKVVVGVDEPGCDDPAVTGDHLVARSGCDRAELGDDTTFDRHLAGPARSSENCSCGHTLSYRASAAAVN